MRHWLTVALSRDRLNGLLNSGWLRSRVDLVAFANASVRE